MMIFVTAHRAVKCHSVAPVVPASRIGDVICIDKGNEYKEIHNIQRRVRPEIYVKRLWNSEKWQQRNILKEEQMTQFMMIVVNYG